LIERTGQDGFLTCFFFSSNSKGKVMKKHGRVVTFLSLGMMALWFCGCAAKKVETTEVPKEPEANEAVKAETAKPVPGEKYVVKEGDTLWAISRQTGIYSDSFEWPLIFKTDRDQIQDPDQINPGQVLLIQKGQSTAQVAHARQLASDTPAFVKHAEPRTTLPVNYF
jgi:LysM repeat protein